MPLVIVDQLLRKYEPKSWIILTAVYTKVGPGKFYYSHIIAILGSNMNVVILFLVIMLNYWEKSQLSFPCIIIFISFLHNHLSANNMNLTWSYFVQLFQIIKDNANNPFLAYFLLSTFLHNHAFIKWYDPVSALLCKQRCWIFNWKTSYPSFALLQLFSFCAITLLFCWYSHCLKQC